jgi:rRNA biogenesis protein RRP5
LEDFQRLYDAGDKVKVIVLNVDQEKKRVSLGLKASYFENEDEEMPDADDEEPSDEAGDIIETDSEPPEDDPMQIDSFAATPTESQATPLAVEGFNWTGETVLDQADQLLSESDSDSDSEAEKERTAKRKHKRSDIKYDKTLSLPLSSAADYERTLLSQPDSSLIWTQYMAHLLQLGEVDKARSIAERALKIINIREEGEKLNIWVAYLNMENSFGTDETLEEVFRRACEYTDKKRMHSHLVSILIKSGKDDKADEMFQIMIKKFSQSSKVWVNYAIYLMEHNRTEEGREMLPRSLKILPKRKRMSDSGFP